MFAEGVDAPTENGWLPGNKHYSVFWGPQAVAQGDTVALDTNNLRIEQLLNIVKMWHDGFRRSGGGANVSVRLLSLSWNLGSMHRAS
eukprot:11799122-Alexandrium_andersonii.AAC.1